MTDNREGVIVFQGEAGANSHIACRECFPKMTPMPCHSVADVFGEIIEGRADLAMVPIENSLAGRVADFHHLIPEAGAFIVGEHFLRIRHQLLALSGARAEDLKTVYSHEQALGQCREVIRALSLKQVASADTAGAARMVAEGGDASRCAIASLLAAEIHGLQVLRPDAEDADHNTTRFMILASGPLAAADLGGENIVTSFMFKVRNVPAALYKALGGFASNGVNMTKLESYHLQGSFVATQFYADIEGRPEDRNVRLAMEELAFFTSEQRILGVYPASPLRANLAALSRE